ncbi:MAG TPA: tetratricopeptide repeat protein, partial [Candidatus Paceibacterota bacterium]
SETNILKIRSLVQTSQVQAGKAPDAEVVSSISSLIDEAIGYTRSAIAIDPANYYNYVAEARISEVALSLGVPSAYENIKTAYGNAIAYNPYNPSLYLSLARVEASQNKLTEAQGFIGQALQLKQNYTEAIFLLSQIQVTQGKIKDAITSVEVATGINPTNPLLFFQLGLLHYNDKNYTKAVDVLNQAIRLDNSYANARYFLGLSYARLGKTADAIIQFENLAETNPDNAEVALILSNLKSGKSAFADATPPIDNKPEARKTLPIK